MFEVGKRASGRNKMDDQGKMRQQQREPKKDTSRLTSHKYISLEKAILLKEKNNVGYKKKEVVIGEMLWWLNGWM